MRGEQTRREPDREEAHVEAHGILPPRRLSKRLL